MTTVIGSDVATITDRGEGSHLDSGQSATVKWSGSKAAIAEKYAALLLEQKTFGNIESITKNLSSVPATCTAVYGYADAEPGQVSVSWSVNCEQTTRPIEVHPKFKGVLSPNIIALIKKSISDGTAYLNDWIVSGDDGAHNKYRDYLVEGTTSYVLWQFNVSKTSTAASAASIEIAAGGIGHIIAQADIGMPSDISRAIPSDYDFLKGAISIGKAGPKAQITQEFLGSDDWDSFLYTAATP
jgi:hypothetical protein